MKSKQHILFKSFELVNQYLLFHDKKYCIISAEQEFILHPAVFDMLPLTTENLQCSYSCDFYIQNYRLYLEEISLDNSNNQEDALKPLQNIPVNYNGAILIGTEPVKDYLLQGNRINCFSFKEVFELVFNNGILVTTIDHSRAMLRIRKNLELGLRTLTSKKDVRCIRHFLNSSFMGDYRPFLTAKKRIKYLNSLKIKYQTNSQEK